MAGRHTRLCRHERLPSLANPLLGALPTKGQPLEVTMNGGTMKRSRARLAAFASLLLAALVPATMARADSPVPLNNTNCSNYATFTFDDGPDPVNTPYILNALPGLGINAWFFVVGDRVSANPQLVQAEAQAGD